MDVFQGHLKDTLKKAAAHKGSAYVEILQNCNIFNDGAWFDTDRKRRAQRAHRATRARQAADLRQEPRQGHSHERAWTSKSCNSATASPRTISVHDEAKHPRPAYAFLLAQMEQLPGFPTPIGVLRSWDDLPRYEDLMNQQIQDIIAKRGPGDITKLLRSGDTWEVKERNAVRQPRSSHFSSSRFFPPIQKRPRVAASILYPPPSYLQLTNAFRRDKPCTSVLSLL